MGSKLNTVKAAPTVKAANKAADVRPLSQQGGKEKADAISAALNGAWRSVAAAALVATDGNVTVAAGLVGDSVRPTIALIARIIPLLRDTAPSDCFTDGNNRGSRVGELFASKLGVGHLYRDASKADIKAAKAALQDRFNVK